MRALPIIDKKTCQILQLRGAYQPDHKVPPGIQEKIDNNLLKLAGEVIVRLAKDRDGEPGGIQDIGQMFWILGLHIPAHLEFPISVDQRAELEETLDKNDELKKRVDWLREALQKERKSNEKMETGLHKQRKKFKEKQGAQKAHHTEIL